MNHSDLSQKTLLKKSLLMAAAVAAVTVPMLLSAAVKHGTDAATVISYETGDAGQVQNPERLYQKLKAVSRDMCGSTSPRITASLRLAAANKACYEGTLEAAVKRLDDPKVSALHRRDVASL